MLGLGVIRRGAYLLTFIVTPLLFAEPQIGTQWSQTTTTLIHQGITQIGDFDVVRFQNEAQKIRWKLYSSQNPPRFAHGRRSAYYLSSSQEVFISDQIPRHMGDSMVLLELHEAMGALGYKDQDYSLSVGLQLLSQMPQTRTRDFVLKELGKNLFKGSQINSSAKVGGSGSSVGGGGDIIPLTIKYEVLQHLVEKGKTVTKEFLIEFPKIAFEPLYDKREQFVGLLYKADPALKRSLDHEKITIYVPVFKWQKGSKSRRQVTNEIIDHVTSLFPAYPGTPKNKVSPLNCHTKETVYFPVAKTSEIAFMQQIRAAILLNCEGSLQITELRSPSFLTPEEKLKLQKRPEPSSSSNLRNHECLLNLNGYKIQFEANLLKQDNTARVYTTAYSSRKGQVTADTLLYTYVISDKNGFIKKISFSEHSMITKKILVEFDRSFGPRDKKELKTKTFSKNPVIIHCQEDQR